MNATQRAPVTNKTVLDLLRQAWPGMTGYPDLSECQWIANNLLTITRAGLPPRKAPATPVEKYGKLFLSKIPEARMALNREAQNRIIMYDGEERVLDRAAYDRWQMAQSELEHVERHLAAVLAALGELRQPMQWTDPATYIMDVTVMTWQSARIEVPLGFEVGKPMCKFVQLALESIGHKYSQYTVFKALSGDQNLALVAMKRYLVP